MCGVECSGEEWSRRQAGGGGTLVEPENVMDVE